MKNLSLILVVGLQVLVLSGCGSSDNGGGGSGSGADASVNAADSCSSGRSDQYKDATSYLCYSYSSNINGAACTTHKKEFTSGSSYCSALQDDSQNNNCAHDKRMDDYSKYCSS